MKNLKYYIKGNFLNEGDPDLLEKIRPAFIALTNRLEELGTNATMDQKFSAFAEAFKHINQYETDIETVERETILNAIYDIGEIVGLDRESEFAEEWRGDW